MSRNELSKWSRTCQPPQTKSKHVKRWSNKNLSRQRSKQVKLPLCHLKAVQPGCVSYICNCHNIFVFVCIVIINQKKLATQKILLVLLVSSLLIPHKTKLPRIRGSQLPQSRGTPKDARAGPAGGGRRHWMHGFPAFLGNARGVRGTTPDRVEVGGCGFSSLYSTLN